MESLQCSAIKMLSINVSSHYHHHHHHHLHPNQFYSSISKCECVCLVETGYKSGSCLTVNGNLSRGGEKDSAYFLKVVPTWLSGDSNGDSWDFCFCMVGWSYYQLRWERLQGNQVWGRRKSQNSVFICWASRRYTVFRKEKSGLKIRIFEPRECRWYLKPWN